MTVDSAIRKFRRSQAAIFRDEGRIERPSGTGTIDPVSGDYVADPPTVLYEGPGLLRIQKWQGTDIEAGGEELRKHEVSLKLPVDTPAEANDVWVHTASTYDQSLVGRHFRITDIFRDGWQISRRFLLEEITD